MKRPVYIVGAGPGDPGLITVRGLTCLQAADVVIHDHRVPAGLLQQARPSTEIIDVGHTSPQSMAQAAISYLIADKAREGKRVVRLKWGDPFVFDRGGEEALYLHEQGIPYEIVPGIPAGIAAPAFAGIPVSYPGGGETITLVRGYEDETRSLASIDWASLVRLGGTIVCYAHGQQLPRILDALVTHGWPPDGQIAIIHNATLPNQETVSGMANDLIESVRHATHRGPAILVVGVVVGFREHLRWFETRPLFGKRVLVTRPREQAPELVERLAALGADTIVAPMIRIRPPLDATPLARAAAEPDAFDWIVFASGNAVDAFMQALLDRGGDARALKGPRLCVVGSGTGEKLKRYGINPDLMPTEFTADALVTAMSAHASLDGARVLLPRADIGREVIADQLRAQGAMVTEVIAYRTMLEQSRADDEPDVYRMLLDGQIDVVTFTSASAVRNFVTIYGNDEVVDLLKDAVVGVIGPVTAETATSLGLTVTIQPATYTLDGLVDAIAAHFAGSGADAGNRPA